MAGSNHTRTQLWKKKIEKLLFSNKLCGICFSTKQNLEHCDNIFRIETQDLVNEYSLKYILDDTFGYEVSNLLATRYICSVCVNIVLKAHRLMTDIRINNKVLHKYLNIISDHAENSITTKTERKQLMLTIDNVTRLNVPSTVTVSNQDNAKENVTQIFLCEIDDLPSCKKVDGSKEKEYKYECPYCGKQINDYQLFKNHFTSHSETAFRCCKCSKKFVIFEKLISHRDTDHADLVSYCNKCQIILHGEGIEEHENIHKNQKEHENQIHNNQTYICDTCKESFVTKSALESHISTSHTQITCQYCLKEFSNEFKLNHHRCLFKCLECYENCIHAEYLESYRKQYFAMQKKFKCIKCDFLYDTRSQLICHVNEEHLEHFPYLCDLCGEKFASKPHLTGHTYKKHMELEVLNTRKFDLNEFATECDQCGKKFDSEEAYCKHMKKHLNEQTQCLYCSNTYSNIARLNLHIRNKHPEEYNSKKFIYKCTMCPEDFSSRPDFLSHIALHPEGTEHKCWTCGEKFKSKGAYFSHVRKHTINYDRECPICFNKLFKKQKTRLRKKQLKIEKQVLITASDILFCKIKL